MPGEIDCPWRDVDVHDPVDDLGLEVALVLVDHILLPGVEQLDEREVGLVLLGDWLIDFFVVLYPLKEVGDGLKYNSTSRKTTTNEKLVSESRLAQRNGNDNLKTVCGNLVCFDPLVVRAVHLHLSHIALHNDITLEKQKSCIELHLKTSRIVQSETRLRLSLTNLEPSDRIHPPQMHSAISC